MNIAQARAEARLCELHGQWHQAAEYWTAAQRNAVNMRQFQKAEVFAHAAIRCSRRARGVEHCASCGTELPVPTVRLPRVRMSFPGIPLTDRELWYGGVPPPNWKSQPFPYGYGEPRPNPFPLNDPRANALVRHTRGYVGP